MGRLVDWLDRKFSEWERRTRERAVEKSLSQEERYRRDNPDQGSFF